MTRRVRTRSTAGARLAIVAETDGLPDLPKTDEEHNPEGPEAVAFAKRCEACPDCVSFVVLLVSTCRRRRDGGCHEPFEGTGADQDR